MVVTCCKGLVTIEKVTGQPRFLHEAVRDYLQQRASALFPDGHNLITQLSSEYLATLPMLNECCEGEQQLQERITHVPLIWYAASSLGFHSQKCETEAMQHRILGFLLPESRRSCIAQIIQYLLGRHELYWAPKEAQSYTKLHLVCFFGLTNTLIKLVDIEDTSVNTATSIGTTPLMLACSNGHVPVVEVLLTNHADPAMMNWYGTSLHITVEARQDEAVEALLKNRCRCRHRKHSRANTSRVRAQRGTYFDCLSSNRTRMSWSYP